MNANYSAGCLLELSTDELQETCDVRGEHGLALIDRWWRLATIVARQPIGVRIGVRIELHIIELHILGRKPQKLPWSVHRLVAPTSNNIVKQYRQSADALWAVGQFGAWEDKAPAARCASRGMDEQHY